MKTLSRPFFLRHYFLLAIAACMMLLLQPTPVAQLQPLVKLIKALRITANYLGVWNTAHLSRRQRLRLGWV